MKFPVLGSCLLASLAAVGADARRFTPGVAFTAKLKSTNTGATATMILHTRPICAQFPVLNFRCQGRWECEGAACPGRRGQLAFIFDRGRYDEVMVLAGRNVCVMLSEVGPEPPPLQPPFHWRYDCLAGGDSSRPIDSGTVVVEWKFPS